MGMSPHDFWEGDVTLPIFYRKMHKNKLKREVEDDNFRSWLNGRYIYEAFAVVLANAFAKKGAKTAEYPSEPYDLFKEREQDKIEQKKNNENIRFKLQMNALTKQFADLPLE